jgi:TonB family protein
LAVKKSRLVLLAVLGAIVTIFFAVSIGGQLLGQCAPERVSFAYTARLNASPADLWTKLGWPERRTEIRQWPDGTKYEAFPGDTNGSLLVLYEPYSRVVSHFKRPHAETWRIETLTPQRGGTLARIEESAILRTSWHRLLFPARMKGWSIQGLRDYGRAIGQPKPFIIRDPSPPLAFTLNTKESAPVEISTYPPATPAESPVDAPTEALPKLGEYVYVEELPQPIAKVMPIYPDVARRSGIQGTVVVQALIGKDGHVKMAHVLKSVPMLDAAALTCVKNWVFTPARARGGPVAVWVAIPVRFTLKE